MSCDIVLVFGSDFFQKSHPSLRSFHIKYVYFTFIFFERTAGGHLQGLEEDGFASRLLLDVGGEALQELGVLPLRHSSEDRGRSPASRVH